MNKSTLLRQVIEKNIFKLLRVSDFINKIVTIFIFSLFFISDSTYSQPKDIFNSCYNNIIKNTPDDYVKFNKSIEDICDLYQVIYTDTNNIINDADLINNNQKYEGNFTKYSEDLIKLDKFITQTAIDNNISNELRDNLHTILNISLESYYNARDSLYRAKQKIPQVGGFLIGAQGYIQLLGVENYLGIQKDSFGRNIPVKLRVIPVYHNLQASNRCTRGHEISFEQNFNIRNFFEHNEKLLAFRDNTLSLINKKDLLETDETAFCVVRAQDGFRLEQPGDYFLNNTADGFVRNINLSGTYILQSEIKELDFKRVRNRGNFIEGNNGYLRLVDNNSPIDKYLKFKPVINSYLITDKIKLKIIPPLIDDVSSLDPQICHSKYVFSLEVVDKAVITSFEKVLTHKGRTILVKNKAILVSLRDKKDATFCLEQKGDYFRIKNLYGFYFDNQAEEISDDVYLNGMTNLPHEAGVFDFSHAYIKGKVISQGEVGPFKINNQGFIKLVSDSDNVQYISHKVLVKNEYDLPQDVVTGKIAEPIEFNIIPALLSNLVNVCSEKDVAVSFEFAHQSDYVLARDEWRFKKVLKFEKDIDVQATFCIEKLVDSYNIKAAGGYFIDNTATGFTQNIDYYGNFDFVSDLIPTNEITYIDVGPFKPNVTGYIKTVSNDNINNISPLDVYLNIKNINNRHYNLHKVEILELNSQSRLNLYDKISCHGNSAVKIINTNGEILNNYYGSLYFINRNIDLPDNSSVFCLRKLNYGYALYSDFTADGSRLYIAQTGNSLTKNLDKIGHFTLISELPKEKFANNFQQGDVGVFRINSKGYLKLKHKNVYVNTEQYQERYNNRRGVPIKFKLIEPLGNVVETQAWCPNSMAITFEDAYDSSKVLAYNNQNLDLRLTPKTADDLDMFAVFCLEHSPSGEHYRIRNRDGFYIDNITASKISLSQNEMGEFLFYDRPLQIGTGNNSTLNQVNGSVLMFNDLSGNNLYITSDLNSNSSKLIFTQNIMEAKGFVIEPGLADETCFSLGDISNNYYVVYQGPNFIMLPRPDVNSSLYQSFTHNSTFCPVVEPFNHSIALSLYNQPNKFFALEKEPENDNSIYSLVVKNKDFIPFDQQEYSIELEYKRYLIKERLFPRQRLTNVDCINHAPYGQKVGIEQRDILGPCPTIKNLRDSMRDDIQSYDENQQCCTGVSFRYVVATDPMDNNNGCKITFDLICSDGSTFSNSTRPYMN